jgi:hypothetical protein
MRPLQTKSVHCCLWRQFGSSLPDRSLDAICTVADGNPLIMWKIIDYVKETQLEDLDYILFGFEDSSFIGSLLEQLPASLCVILKLASVIGEEFESSILSRILPETLCPQLPLFLKRLENSGFISGIADGQFAFSSPLFRTFLYNLLPPR